MNWRAKHFLRRRRWDSFLAGVAGAGMPLRHGITMMAAAIFAAIGIYLVAAKHGKSRQLAPVFLCFAVAYFMWTAGLMIWRDEPLLSSRQTTYALLIATFAFIANGLVLVKDPIRSFVLGSRIGVLLAAVLSVALTADSAVRFGLGGNPAPFAMVAAICMIAASLPIRFAPKWAPNSPIYAVIGAVPIFQSETRALLIIVPIVVLTEFAVWLVNKKRLVRIISAAIGVAALTAIVATGPVREATDRLFVPVVLYYSGQVSQWEGSSSGDIRLALWRGAVAAIGESPFVGYGNVRMEVVEAHLPSYNVQATGFTHVHNAILDELLINGVPGLLLILCTFLSAFAYVFRRSRDNAIKRNAIYFVLAMGTYGLLHNPLLHETTITGIFVYMAVLISGTSRKSWSQLDLSMGPVTSAWNDRT